MIVAQTQASRGGKVRRRKKKKYVSAEEDPTSVHHQDIHEEPYVSGDPRLLKLSDADKDMCESIFEEMDDDASGYIDKSELTEALMQIMGLKPSKRMVDHMFAAADLDGNGLVDIDEFEHLWQIQVTFKKKLEEETARNVPLIPKVKQCHLKVWYIFEEPSSSKIGTWVSLFIMFVIAVSVTSFVMESVPVFRYWTGGSPGNGQFVGLPIFGILETLSVIVFTFEYVVRLLLVGFAPPDNMSFCMKIRKFVTGTLNTIDLIAILPFYMELLVPAGSAGNGLSVFRILRVARVFRIFKLGKYSNGMQMFASVMVKSRSALLLLLFFLLIAVVLFGALLFFMEEGEWNSDLGGFARPDAAGVNLELSPFTSVPAAFWWVVVTSTTVGYGDLYPTSTGGKMIATLCMILGVLALALPVSVIGANFSEIYQKNAAEEKEKEQHALVRCWGVYVDRISKGAAEKGDGAKEEESKNTPKESPASELTGILLQIAVLSNRATELSSQIKEREASMQASQSTNFQLPFEE